MYGHVVPIAHLLFARLPDLLLQFRVIQENFTQFSYGSLHYIGGHEPKVEHRAHVQYEVAIQIAGPQFAATHIDKHLQRNRYLAVTDVPVLHYVQIPHLHQLLFALVHVRELVDHLHRFVLQPERIAFALRIDVQLPWVHRKAGHGVVVHPAVPSYVRSLAIKLILVRVDKLGQARLLSSGPADK